MKKFAIQVTALIVLLTVVVIVVFNSGTYDFGGILGINPSSTQIERLKIGDAVVNAEVASTPDKRAQGLGGRDSIASDSGMLFVFDKPDSYHFWMKGMRFPLDFIWIRNNTVVDLLKNIAAPSPNQSSDSLSIYAPVTPIDEVLEVNAGFVDQNKISVGQKVQVVN